MCGIYGYTGSLGAADLDRRQLASMGDALRHRGPDDEGFYVGPSAQLGMRRLSIVDLETGQQPVWNEANTVGAVFNGEIFNFIELREELERRGHRFRSHHSDSELIPHLYDEYGDDFVNRLNGMFAIAIWDQKRSRFLLYRDHAGIKPLFYSVQSAGVVFASEIKAILRHPWVEKRPDFDAISHYFTFKNVPSPFTAFEGISQVLPGMAMVWERTGARSFCWWNFSEAVSRAKSQLSGRRPEDAILETLRRSVEIRLRTDVGYGAYLSGGVDSSAVTALMAQLTGKRIKTFTLAYTDLMQNKESDRRFAKVMSERLGTEHYELEISSGDLARDFDQILQSFDQPFSGTISTYFLTRLISQHVKVALSGDGADEIFGSYKTHRISRPLALLRQYGGKLRGIPSELVPDLGEFQGQGAFLERLAALPEAAWREAMLVFGDEEKSRLLLKGSIASRSLIAEKLRGIGESDPLNRTLAYEFQTLLPDQILAFVDFLSMAHSVEVRPPFLDPELIALGFTIRGENKVGPDQVKKVLRDSLRSLLPDSVLDRPKEGFVMPVYQWMGSALRQQVREELRAQAVAQAGVLNPVYVEELASRFFEKGEPLHDKIWNIYCFQRWWKLYF